MEWSWRLCKPITRGKILIERNDKLKIMLHHLKHLSLLCFETALDINYSGSDIGSGYEEIKTIMDAEMNRLLMWMRKMSMANKKDGIF